MQQMLKVDDIHTYYGKSHILNGVCLQIVDQSGIALSGRNGVGKTTTLRSIIGFTPPQKGTITFKGVNVTGFLPHRISRMGMALVPQGRRIFTSLSIQENLLVAAYKTDKSLQSHNLERVVSLFPVLSERFHQRAKTLSGGEMQMLAIGRALMAAPQLLLMDEPTEGLAPLFIEEIKRVILTIKSQKGTSILLVEQNFQFVLDIADYVYVMNKGKVVYESDPRGLENNEEIRMKYLGLGR